MGELEKAQKLLNDKFGNNYLNYGGKFSYDDYKRKSFGIFALDIATGGGIPEGKVVTIAGKYSSGKTTAAICMAAECQKNGGKVAWIDTDNGLDPIWAAKYGLNYQKLLICQPNTIEEVGDTIEPLIITKELDLIVFDSVAATPSKKELEETSEQKSMGGIAKEVGLLMRKVTTRLRGTKTSLLIINQLRDKIGGWGAAEYMPGGNQLKNQSDIMIYMRASDWVGDKKNPEGITIKFRVSKNRTAPPLQIGSYELLFKGEVNNKHSIYKQAVLLGILKKIGVNKLKDKDIPEVKKRILQRLKDGAEDKLSTKENTKEKKPRAGKKNS